MVNCQMGGGAEQEPIPLELHQTDRVLLQIVSHGKSSKADRRSKEPQCDCAVSGRAGLCFDKRDVIMAHHSCLFSEHVKSQGRLHGPPRRDLQQPEKAPSLCCGFGWSYSLATACCWYSSST